MPYYRIFYCRFPAACEGKLYGIASLFPDGQYIILINTEMDEATQAHALRHELAHLFFKHLDREEAQTEEELQAREQEADEYADKMTGEELEYLLSFCTGRKTIKEADIAAFDEQYALQNAV